MARISKPPEIRKQELIDVALHLFIEKGYEAVSVRDILKEVKGHPGMFYYYFESKREIYNEAMRQMIQKEIELRTNILLDHTKPILIRFKVLFKQLQESITVFYKTFTNPDSIAYQTTVLLNLLEAMVNPIATFIMEAVEEGIIPPESKVTEETVYPMAKFIIFGVFGLNTSNVEANTSVILSQDTILFVARILKIPEEILKEALE